MASITIKRGQTLSFIVKRSNDLGEPLTGDAAKLSSQIRDSAGLLIATFVITETATAGEYLFYVPSSLTKDFPEYTLYFDIWYHDTGIDYPSETYTISVEKWVTQHG